MDGTLERFHDLSIFFPEIGEFPCMILKKRRNRVDRIALFELFGDGMVI